MIQWLCMKKNFAVCIVFIFSFLFIPESVFALGVTPFGGRITAVRTPPTVQCGTSIESPFMINPVIGAPGPWSTFPGRVNAGKIVPGAWIMGLMLPAPGACVTTTTPPAPFPTTATNFYGTSANLSF
jgi:hypothetical protein